MSKFYRLTTFIPMITTEVSLKTVESTMEEAKARAVSQDFLLVTAEEQTHGKGTRGRIWSSLRGNIQMTVGIHRRNVSDQRLSLLPLEIGLHVWEEAAAWIRPINRPSLSLKWPNDLLYQGGKVAGILIESYKDFFMVGVGINVVAGPTITDGGTRTACLAEAGMASDSKDSCIEGLYRRIISHKEMPGIPNSNSELANLEDAADAILLGWQGKVDWNQWHRLRDREGQPLVKPISVNRQGHLQVEHGDGWREWLVADYLV